MATYNLNLNGDFSSEVLSYYIWGQAKAPNPSEIANSKWIDRKDSTTISIIGGGWILEPVKFAGSRTSYRDYINYLKHYSIANCIFNIRY